MSSDVSRRGFMAGLGGLAAAGLLAGCATGPAKSTSAPRPPLKFWGMPWGTPAYTAEVQRIVKTYRPSGGHPSVHYQSVQWPAQVQTFTSAIASHTGPDLADGGAWNAIEFAAKGAVRYSDDLIAKFKKSGLYDDFLPGTFDPFKTNEGYVAIPWNLDVRALWYRKSLFEKANVQPPTDWNSWLTAGKALKKIGVYAFGTGAGSGNTIALQAMVAMLHNNGGGLFDAAGNPDCVTARNIETMDFFRELVGQGIVDPGAISYSSANVLSQWTNKRWAMGWFNAGLDQAAGDTSGDLDVLSPLSGPHGDKGSLYWVNPLLMFKTKAREDDIEAFITHYVHQWGSIWGKGLVSALPPLKSISDSDAFKKSATNVKIVKEWQPISKTTSSLSDKVFPQLAAIDGGQAMLQWSQTMLAGKTSSKTALTALQHGIESVMSK